MMRLMGRRLQRSLLRTHRDCDRVREHRPTGSVEKGEASEEEIKDPLVF